MRRGDTTGGFVRRGRRTVAAPDPPCSRPVSHWLLLATGNVAPGYTRSDGPVVDDQQIGELGGTIEDLGHGCHRGFQPVLAPRILLSCPGVLFTLEDDQHVDLGRIVLVA